MFAHQWPLQIYLGGVIEKAVSVLCKNTRRERSRDDRKSRNIKFCSITHNGCAKRGAVTPLLEIEWQRPKSFQELKKDGEEEVGRVGVGKVSWQ